MNPDQQPQYPIELSLLAAGILVILIAQIYGIIRPYSKYYHLAMGSGFILIGLAFSNAKAPGILMGALHMGIFARRMALDKKLEEDAS